MLFSSITTSVIGFSILSQAAPLPQAADTSLDAPSFKDTITRVAAQLSALSSIERRDEFIDGTGEQAAEMPPSLKDTLAAISAQLGGLSDLSTRDIDWSSGLSSVGFDINQMSAEDQATLEALYNVFSTNNGPELSERGLHKRFLGLIWLARAIGSLFGRLASAF